MRRTFATVPALLALFLAGPLPLVAAAEPAPVSAGPSRWAVHVGGGYFTPAVDGWKDQYGRSGGWLPSLSAAYAVTSRWWVAAEAASFTAESRARDVTGNPSIQRQRLALYPITLGVEHGFRFSEDQLVVPFLGVGYRRVVYRLAVETKDRVQGGAGGLVARGGLDVLLNALDPSSASGLQEDWKIERSYLRVEAQWAKVNAGGAAGTGDIDLGGKTFLAALKFEF